LELANLKSGTLNHGLLCKAKGFMGPSTSHTVSPQWDLLPTFHMDITNDHSSQCVTLTCHFKKWGNIVIECLI
jgi:hypothetical protein